MTTNTAPTFEHSQNSASRSGKHAEAAKAQPVERLSARGHIIFRFAALAILFVIIALLFFQLVSQLIASTSDRAPMVNNALTDVEQLSGWVSDESGIRRYYDPATHSYYNGWLNEPEGTYYIDGETGTAHVGWLLLDEKLYWLDDGTRTNAGILLKDQWLVTDGSEYYLKSDGSATVGWADLEGKRYYFDDTGKNQTGWIDDGSGKVFYIRPEDGTQPHHEWIVMDGIYQAFDDDGSWVNAGDIIPPNDEESVAHMSERQQAVINACNITPWPGRALCAAWVSSVFVNAGEPAVGGDACDIAHAWCTSDDLTDLKPGMVIAVATHSRTENGRIWGHVCIYAGNGLVRDSGATETRWVTLGTWFAWYGTLEQPRWGWANGIPLT